MKYLAMECKVSKGSNRVWAMMFYQSKQRQRDVDLHTLLSEKQMCLVAVDQAAFMFCKQGIDLDMTWLLI